MFDRDTFMQTHGTITKVIVNPEKRIKKLLLKVVELWTEVFLPENFKTQASS